jgi:hypothetical protein
MGAAHGVIEQMYWPIELARGIGLVFKCVKEALEDAGLSAAKVEPNSIGSLPWWGRGNSA